MALKQICEDIDTQLQSASLTDNDFDTLKRVIGDNIIDLNMVKEYINPPAGKPYGRNLIYASEKLEVILMNWEKDEFCDIHNHGCSFGIALVLQGDIKNQVFDENYKLNSESIHRSGSYINVPKDAFHNMGNLSKSDHAITLHFYAPPIHKMKVVDVENDLIATVNDDCGAWLTEKSKILETEKIFAKALVNH